MLLGLTYIDYIYIYIYTRYIYIIFFFRVFRNLFYFGRNLGVRFWNLVVVLLIGFRHGLSESLSWEDIECSSGRRNNRVL